ncbi:MAG TPA: hypothetical protein VKT32_11230 [Chthonomonadaceae bacterium]|nr:hypothetical protein [Chthonomonadaceae bacterium]
MAGERTQHRTETRAYGNREHEGNRRSGQGRGWHGDPEGHAAAGRKGGQKVASDREHMAQIGRKGGEAVSQDRRHMADIGRKGGQARGKRGADSAQQPEDQKTSSRSKRRS